MTDNKYTNLNTSLDSKKKRPLVSVVMPTYNCGQFIIQSIDSVILQTIKDWEIEIVDDCSTDDTQLVLEPYLMKYSKIHYHRLESNGGPAVARTEAIKYASGKYVAFLDSDDLWTTDKLEKQINFMRKTGAVFTCTGYKQMNATGSSLHMAIIPPKKIDYKRCIILSNPIGNLTVMYDQDVLGKFSVPNIKKRNDFALWLQILKITEYCYGMQDVLATYRLGRQGSVSHNKIIQIKYHWQLYHEIEKHDVIRCLLEILCWAFVKGTGIGVKKIAIG